MVAEVKAGPGAPWVWLAPAYLTPESEKDGLLVLWMEYWTGQLKMWGTSWFQVLLNELAQGRPRKLLGGQGQNHKKIF